MNQNTSNPWKWVAIIGGIVVFLSCGVCVIARVACSRAEDAIVSGLTGTIPPGTPSAQMPTARGPFDALASHLHIGDSYQEGPGAHFLTDGAVDEYTGVAVRVFHTESGPRIAYLMADRTLRDSSRAEREAWVRSEAQELESMFPGADLLFAIRGRMFFGASAMKIGDAAAWHFQAGTTIDENSFDAFFAGALPEPAPTPLGEEAYELTGEFDATAQLEPDCAGYAVPIRPAMRLQLPADRPQLTLELEGETGVAIVMRRPDGVLRCEIEYERAVLSGRFPPGTYDVWVGALLDEEVISTGAQAFTLSARAIPGSE